MGTVCARCAAMEKANNTRRAQPAPELDDSDFDRDHADSEMTASSEEEDAYNVKQGVEEILRTIGKNLKRGKTMAMKEAIHTAKKHNVDSKLVLEAERLLDNHKRRQWQEEVEHEVENFFASSHVMEIPACESVLMKVKEAECRAEVMERVQHHLDELIITRKLEEYEAEHAREILKRSCREFVHASVKGRGRPVTVLALDDGRRTPAVLSIDPPLEYLRLVRTESTDGADVTFPVATLSASNGKDNKQVVSSKGFSSLDAADMDCVVAIKYNVDGVPGVLCLCEPKPSDRDRLKEAVVMLMATYV